MLIEIERACIEETMERESGQISRKKSTKPSVMTDSVVSKLARYIGNGYSIEMACRIAGVSRMAYYDHINKFPDRAEMFELMKRMPTEQALQNIVEAVYL